MHAAGDWTISVWLRKSGPDATVEYETKLATAACQNFGALGSGSFSVTSTSWVQFQDTTALANLWVPGGYVIYVTLKETAGAAELEYNQLTPSFINRTSLYRVPDLLTVRPHDYYKRQRRRRSC